MSAFDGLLRETMIVTGIVSLPIVIAAAMAGIAVAIVQAATQVQEQTLTLLPKILVVGIVLAAGGGFGLHLLEQLFQDAVATIPGLVYGS